MVFVATLFPFARGENDLDQRLPPEAVHDFIADQVVPIVIEILKNPDDQVAYQAAQLLGEMGVEPALAVPALTQAAQSTNALVASTAKRALAQFQEEAR